MSSEELLNKLKSLFSRGFQVKVRLKIRDRGKRGYDISSVPFKKLEKANKYKKKMWELKGEWLILDAF